MGTSYVVAVDGSSSGWKAMELAAKLAQSSDATLLLAHVVPNEPIPPSVGEWARIEGISTEEAEARVHTSRTMGDGITREAEKRARDMGCTNVSARVYEGHVADQLVELAKDSEADMIFLGSRGLSDVQGLLMGSVSHKVAHMAPCTCVLVR